MAREENLETGGNGPPEKVVRAEKTPLIASEEEIQRGGDLEESTGKLKCLGYSFAVVAGFCFTASNVGIKYCTDASSWHLLFIRCLIQMAVMAPLMWFTNSSPLGPPDIATRWRLVAQGILGGIFLWLINESVERLPIGDSTAIFFSGPVFTMILSTCLLRDHCGLYRTIIGIVLMGGILVISRPPGVFPQDLLPTIERQLLETANNLTHTSPSREQETHGHKLVGIGVALLVPVFSAFLAILTRQLRHVHYSVLVFWFAVGGQVISTIFVITLDAKQTFSEWDARTWLLCFFQSVIGIVGAMLMTKAVCWVTPAKTMVIRSLQIIVAYAIQVFAFGTVPHLADLAGAACIIAAVFAMFTEETIMAKVPWRFL